MQPALLKWLRCPKCQESYRPSIDQKNVEEIIEGALLCRCPTNVPIRSSIPRFVRGDGYTRSFSFEWNIHAKTQLDSASGLKRSEEQFQERLDVPLEWLKGKLVLDTGCGSGRYAEIAAKNGAEVIGIDLSDSVDAARKNLRQWSNVHLIQADLFSLPFAPETFDFIYSFGVLHHTPDCAAAFRQLPRLLKPGGKLSIFVYSSYNKAIVYSSAIWRSLTTRMPMRLLYYLCFIAVPLYFVYRIPLIGHIGRAVFVIPMIPNWRWRVLDTFDWYSPRYQSKHTHWEVFHWFEDEGLTDVKVLPGEVTMIGRKIN